MKEINVVPYRLAQLSGIVHGACGMDSWCFGPGKKLYMSTSPHGKEFSLFLNVSGCLDRILEHKEEYREPRIFSDTLGMIWIAENVFEGEKFEYLVIMGPVFLTNLSVKSVIGKLDAMGYSIQVRNQYVKILNKVPVLSIDMIQQYAAMLYYTVMGNEAPEPEILFDESAEKSEKTGDDITEEADSYGDSVDYERGYLLQETLLGYIRSGNLYFEEELAGGKEDAGEDNRTYYPSDLIDLALEDQDRLVRDNIIMFIALCSKTAIESALSVRVARHIEREYVSRVEKISTVTSLGNLNWEMIHAYAEAVHRIRENPKMSRISQECCDFIEKNFQKPLKLSDIAESVGYTEYYLSRRFYKEMGIRLLDYLKDVRLNHAKILLITTNLGIQEISDRLQFSSRSYFSKVFQKKIGMSPAEYRARMGKATEEE